MWHCFLEWEVVMNSNYVFVSPHKAVVNGKAIECQSEGKQLLLEVYRTHIGGYPKFFKMDPLCQLGFVASELLVKELGNRDLSDCAVILFNRSSSYCNDRMYQETIQDNGNFFPSPSIFVYTLPNIVTGEIAIKNKIFGETSFYLLDRFDPEYIAKVVATSFAGTASRKVICGWVDCYSENDFMASLAYFENEQVELDTIEKTFELINSI